MCLFSVEEVHVDTVNRHLRENGFGNLSRIQMVESLEAIPVLGTGKTDYRSLTDRLKEITHI
jgi:long-chain-fatty-acid--[acyl-carrier-protein] ligase